jgi:NAD(P)-dependent dehydrogenase (short-subunit alcohol dehydrogenase family)
MNKPGTSTVFVVSGGARGITAQCVIAMAHRYRCKFILLGRSAQHVPELAAVDADAADEAALTRQVIAYLSSQGSKPSPAAVQRSVQAVRSAREIAATVQAVEQAGGEALYISADVTSLEALRAALPAAVERLGPVRGIIHGAGTLADKLIEKKTSADFERVYNAKIIGLENLLACVPLADLEYLVLFTSVVGFYGNAGQSDYAIANDILNKAAHAFQRTNPACRVVAINWGPWDGGMVTDALKQHFAAQNIPVIPVDAGVQMFLRELEQPQTTPQVVIGHPVKRADSHPGSELRTYRLRRRLTLQDNPFLYDHVVGGRPVLAAVFGVAWMTNACEQLYPGYTFFRFHEYKVLKGIVFDETLADSYTLEVQEVATSDEEIVCDALIWSAANGDRKRFHYRGQVVLRREIPEPPMYADYDLSETDVILGEQLYSDGTLFHGPSFQGIMRTLNIGPQHVTTQCYVPDLPLSVQGQFPIQTFNPYLTDIKFQCMLVWVRRYHQAGGMPLQAQQIELFRTLRPGQQFYVSMQVQSSSENSLVANVIAHDAEGRVYLRVTGTAVTISQRLNTLFAQSRVERPASQPTASGGHQ